VNNLAVQQALRIEICRLEHGWRIDLVNFLVLWKVEVDVQNVVCGPEHRDFAAAVFVLYELVKVISLQACPSLNATTTARRRSIQTQLVAEKLLGQRCGDSPILDRCLVLLRTLLPPQLMEAWTCVCSRSFSVLNL
jgi:hypothetical protein